jgi:hypothetical protein
MWEGREHRQDTKHALSYSGNVSIVFNVVFGIIYKNYP